MANLLDVLAKVQKGSGVEGRLYDYVMRLLVDPSIIARNPGEYAVLLGSLPQSKMPELRSIPISEIGKQLSAIAALDASDRSQLQRALEMQNLQMRMKQIQAQYELMSKMLKDQSDATKLILRNL